MSRQYGFEIDKCMTMFRRIKDLARLNWDRSKCKSCHFSVAIRELD